MIVLPKILHVISSLGRGGAESALLRISSMMQKMGYDSRVVGLAKHSDMVSEFEAKGTPSVALAMSRSPGALVRAFRRCISELRGQRPDLIQTWMYHADFVGGLLGRVFSRAPIVWNIRHTNLDRGANKSSTLLIAKICAYLSTSVPKAIVSCSYAAVETHVKFGYDRRKMVVIPNGFDTDYFCPDESNSSQVRAEWGIAEDALVFGFVGRFHRQKNPHMFVEMAAKLISVAPKLYFVMAGTGLDSQNSELCALIKRLGLEDRFKLLGPVRDVRRTYRGLDFLCSTSIGEGFPNVIAEAMACARICVVTDVGDSARVVGKTGRIVPAKDSEQFARACAELLALSNEERRQLGDEARRRIEVNYSLQASASHYHDLYQSILS